MNETIIASIKIAKEVENQSIVLVQLQMGRSLQTVIYFTGASSTSYSLHTLRDS